MAGSVDLDRAIVQWLEWDKNPKTLAEVRQLNCDGDIEQLQECFGSRMKFGTAGMRSIMGPGFSHMNDLTIIQTTQGLCRCLEKSFPDVKDRGVVIGFDARAHPPSGSSSQRFARFAATVLVSQGIPVYLFSQITPTPFVVYWDNGAQIVEPHDREIAEAIDKNLEPWSESWNDKLVDCSSLVKDPFENMKNKYLECLQKHCFHRDINKETKLKFVHTSVHGVGHEFVQAALKAFSFTPPLAVPEQKDPDPEFPTVKYPNPEEGKDVLTLSFALADKEGATVILANDPDADRLAVAEKQESGEWKVFSGNELGALLGWWNFTCWKKQNPESSCLKKAYMLSSTVSSKILRAIALKEGFHFEETLTGFKWMGNKAKELIDKGNTVLFAFEEAIGYMSTEFVLDKDGVSAAAIVAELASYLATKNTTLSQNLKAIYEEYGYHLSKASYFICHNPETIDRLFQNLRKYNETNQYPKTCGKFEISDIRDLTTGYDSSQPDKNAVLPTSKSSQMITFTFKNGCVATMRTSGTEPKIKYYAEICAPPGNSDFEKLKEELNDLVNALVEHFFQPDKNGLTSQST
ncbi:phosphoglucomutase-2 isoform X2 [Carcharodon carcharias]|uniref:phosphoglucomutase-2 isoform X2 n=1 Tax=Carcharodon carcharias TaxID=13397 RepID=UPI001B7DA733|nr:phosphoglucomutase-2 isoform X2 [Carcharodon carcharias]